MNTRELDTIANRYFEQLTIQLRKDSEFTHTLDKLAKMETGKNKFDHIGEIAKFKPTAPGALGFVLEVSYWTRDYGLAYRKHLKEKEYQSCQEFLVRSIKTHIDNNKPKQFNTVQECIAYEIFLNRVTSQYLPHVSNQAPIDYVKLEARFRTEVAKVENLNEGIEFLKQHNLKTHAALDAIHQQNQDLQTGQERFHLLLDQVNANVQEDLAASHKIENDLKALGVNTDAKLTTLIKDNKEVRQQLSFVCAYLKNQAEQKKQEENIQGLMNAAGFIGELGRHVGSKDLCRIGVVVQAGVKIATSLMALQGPLSLASLTPVTAIGMSVLSIASAFADQGPNVNQMILDAIQSLAMQLDTLRHEMHERFDSIDSQLADIHLRIISGFCDMQHQHKTMLDLLRDIQENFRRGQEEVRDLFGTLTVRIRNIADTLHVQGRRDKIERIYMPLKKATGVHTLDSRDFKELYNELTAYISELHKCDVLLVGKPALNAVDVVDHFELEEHNPFVAEFNINTICDFLTPKRQERPALVNPMVWGWQVHGLIQLMKRYYETKEMAVHTISIAERKSLEAVAELGEKTVQFVRPFRDTHTLLKLKDKYIKAGLDAITQLQVFIAQEAKELTKNLNQQCVELIEFPMDDKKLEASRHSVFDAFKEQAIPINSMACANWFVADNYNEHRNFGKSWEGTIKSAYAEPHIEKYKKARAQSMTKKQDEYCIDLRRRMDALRGDFQFFSESKVNVQSHYGFAFPQNPNDPLLPLPCHYRFPIPPTVQEAVWKGIGRIEYSYRIEGNEEFVMEAAFVMGDQRQLISTLVTPYEPGIYGEAQFQNRYALSLKPPHPKSAHKLNDTIIYIDTTADGLWYKLDDFDGQTKSGTILWNQLPDDFPKKASEIIKPKNKCLPILLDHLSKIDQGLDRKEALWWFWVGGNYSLDGSTHTYRVYSNTTSEGNTWSHEAYLPVCTNQIGRNELITYDKDKVLCHAKENIVITEQSEYIKQIRQRIHAKQIEYKANLYQKLKKQIENNCESALGKAFVKYSHAYYMLRSVLSLAFGDAMLMRFDEFGFLYNRTEVANRSRFLELLDKSPDKDLSVVDILNRELQWLDANFHQGLKKLTAQPPLDSFIVLVLKELKSLIDWYKLGHEVDNNELCHSMAVEEMQRQQLNTYDGLFACVRDAVLSCSPEAQTELMKAMEKQMSKKGIALPPGGLGLLQFSGQGKPEDKESSKPEDKESPKPLHGSFWTDKSAKNLLPISDSLATDEGIFKTLTEKLGDKAHIIHPGMSSVNNLFAPGNAAAVEYGKEINGHIPMEGGNGEQKAAKGGYIQADGGELKKPIVAILNTSSARAAHAADVNARGGDHWVVLVILPKNYKNLNNSKEQIFLLDSLNPSRAFPPVFREVLTKGYEHSFSSAAAEHKDAPQLQWNHKIPPAFPNPEFVSPADYRKQQVGHTDCGWWAVDNALKLVETGTIAEIMKDYTGPRRADDLRLKYPNLDKEEIQPQVASTLTLGVV